MMMVAVVDGWPKPASSAVRTRWVEAALARSVFCVSVMAGCACVGSCRWTSDSGIGEFAVSTINCLLDFLAVKREFQAAPDGPRDLCCSSALADVGTDSIRGRLCGAKQTVESCMEPEGMAECGCIALLRDEFFRATDD
ncbi:hypothetical protein A9R05_08360 [Burkholderia sp. KK1]|nr:hypothetical protein A9R05_08360 [Burkholderia sp. KK1]